MEIDWLHIMLYMTGLLSSIFFFDSVMADHKMAPNTWTKNSMYIFWPIFIIGGCIIVLINWILYFIKPH